MTIPFTGQFPHPQLKVQQMHIVAEAGPQGLLLPPYPGSTFRGALGHALRKIACSAGKRQACSTCLFLRICPVVAIFQPLVPENHEGFFARVQEIPPPFVLRPLTGGKTALEPGERFELELVLFGTGCKYAPYLLTALRVALEDGIGKGKRRGKIIQVYGINPFSSANVPAIKDESWCLTGLPVITGVDIDQRVRWLLQESGIKVVLRMVTPLRVKTDSHLQNDVDPVALVRAINRRLSVLTLFYGQARWEADFKEYVKKAGQLAVVESDCMWWDWERYSSRQDTKMKLGGLVGQTTIQGPILPELLPLFVWGEIMHVGKATSFGLGAIRVEPCPGA